MTILYLILILFSIIALLIGFFLCFQPELMIEIQRKFYAQINWKIEPISMPKEIRNTRVMGLAIIILLLVTLFFLLIKNPVAL